MFVSERCRPTDLSWGTSVRMTSRGGSFLSYEAVPHDVRADSSPRYSTNTVEPHPSFTHTLVHSFYLALLYFLWSSVLKMCARRRVGLHGDKESKNRNEKMCREWENVTHHYSAGGDSAQRIWIHLEPKNLHWTWTESMFRCSITGSEAKS